MTMTRDEARAVVVEELGEPFAAAYFDRSEWMMATDTVRPWSRIADERLRGRSNILRRAGISIGGRMDPPGPQI